VTQRHKKILEEDWGVGGEEMGLIEVLRPVEKALACGDSGGGAMREWSEIVSIIEKRLDLRDT